MRGAPQRGHRARPPGAARARGLLRAARPPRSGCTQPESTARCSSAATGAGERSRRTPTSTCAGSTAASRSASVVPSSPRDHLGQLAPLHPFFRGSPQGLLDPVVIHECSMPRTTTGRHRPGSGSSDGREASGLGKATEARQPITAASPYTRGD